MYTIPCLYFVKVLVKLFFFPTLFLCLFWSCIYIFFDFFVGVISVSNLSFSSSCLLAEVEYLFNYSFIYFTFCLCVCVTVYFMFLVMIV